MTPRISGILLAAGSSTRFGRNKLLYPLQDDTPLGVASARRLLAVLPASIAVVSPDDRILPALLTQEGLRVVINERAASGIGTSLACGVAAARDARGWVIALADMPYISPSVIEAVATALRQGAAIVAPCYRGQRGHPVGFSKQYRGALMQLDGDRGGQALVREYPEAVTLIDVDDETVIRDIDTTADLLV